MRKKGRNGCSFNLQTTHYFHGFLRFLLTFHLSVFFAWPNVFFRSFVRSFALN